MDVSSPAQRLAALRWLTSSLAGGDDSATPVDKAAVGAARSMVRAHRLLSDGVETGLHRTAVERFVEAVLTLSKSTIDAEAAAGTELLGLCCAEARPAKFASSLSDWGLALCGALGKGSAAVQLAAAGALAELLRRARELDELQGVRRDAAGVLGKAMPALLAVLRCGGGSSGLYLEGLDLLSVALAVMPLSMKSSHKALEEALTGVLFDPAAPPGPTAKAASCLSQLPNVLGSSEAWQDLTRTCLRASHALLDELSPPQKEGKDPVREAALQGGLAEAAGWRDWEPRMAKWGSSAEALALLMGRILELLGLLISGPYSMPVLIPTTGLLLLATRVLGIDTRQLPESGEAVEFASLRLPAIQTSVLNLLGTMTRNAGLSMLPSVGHLARLLADQLRVLTSVEDGAQSTTPAQVREALYCCVSDLLERGGPAAARRLSEAALPACRLELYGEDPAEAAGSSRGHPAKRQRRANHDPGEREVVEQGLLEGFVATRSISAQQAAVRMLRALLDSGGASAPAQQRADMDAMAAHIATACKAAADAAARGRSRDWHGLKRLQLAATHAVLASVQSLSPHRPLYLSQALSIFQSGQFDSCTEVAALCRDSIRALEPMLHPRALPFPRCASSCCNPELRAAASNDITAPSKPCGRPVMWSAVTAPSGLQSCIVLPPAGERNERLLEDMDASGSPQEDSRTVAASKAAAVTSDDKVQAKLLAGKSRATSALTRAAEPPPARAEAPARKEVERAQIAGMAASEAKQVAHGAGAAAAAPSMLRKRQEPSSAQQQRQLPEPVKQARPVEKVAVPSTAKAPEPAPEAKEEDEDGEQAEGEEDEEEEEGSLPDIDSGDDQDESGDEDADDDEMSE